MLRRFSTWSFVGRAIASRTRRARIARSPRLLVPIALLLLMGAGARVAAQPIVQSNFSSTTGLTLNSAATTNSTVSGEGTVVRLVAGGNNDRGSVFTSAPVSVGSGFSTTFNFRISSPGGISDGTGVGADGLAFVLQRIGATALGGTGEGIGYSGLSPSVAVEFDTWLNGHDPNSNHVGVNTNGNLTSLTTTAVTPNFDNGARWTAWIDYNGTTLEVRASTDGLRPTTALLSQTVNLATTLGGTTAYLGFTAATGGATGVHDVLSWALLDSYAASGITMFTWNGTGAWTDTARWNPTAVPTSSDIALVGSGVASLTAAQSIRSLQFSGGTIGGSQQLTLLGRSEWTAGTLSGTASLKVDTGATLVLSGPGNKAIANAEAGATSGPSLVNQGTISWTGGTLASGTGATFANHSGATFSTTFDGTLAHSQGGNRPVFNNAGTFSKPEGTGTTDIQASFNNTGTVTVSAGTLKLSGGGTSTGTVNIGNTAALQIASDYTISTGAQVSGNGTLQLVSGNLALGGSLGVAQFTQTGGLLTGSQTFMRNVAWQAGEWNATTTRETTTVASGGNLTISGTGSRNFNFRTLEIASGGTATWQSGSLRTGNGGGIVNRGTFIDQNATANAFENPTVASGFGGTASFTNEGTYRKTGAGTTTFNVPFTNTGTIQVSGGSLVFNSTFDNRGAFGVADGGTAKFTSAVTFPASTPLKGTGTIDAPQVTAEGQVAPGSSPGSLTITGNLTLVATSTLLIELAGATQGTGYDYLSVGGSATLAGQLNVSFLGGYQWHLPTTSTFTVLNATGGLTGAFANVANGSRLATPDNAATFKVSYGTGSAFAANSVVLSDFIVAVPEPSTYVMLAAGSAIILLSLRRRKR
jgi:autotransporter-associated beta strand protein